MGDLVNVGADGTEGKSRFVATPTATAIIGLLECCQGFGEMGVIIGPPGVGKTAAIDGYVAGHGHAWKVTAKPSKNKLVPCLAMIKDAMVGHWPYLSSAPELHDTITDYLRYRTNCLLIVDEANHLGDDALEELRSLYDECGLAVVLVGPPELVSRWEAKGGKRHADWAQLASRIGPRLSVSAVLPADVAAVCEGQWKWGIDGKAMDLLQKIAKSTYGVRDPVRVVLGAGGYAGTGNRITVEHVDAAMKLRGMAR